MIYGVALCHEKGGSLRRKGRLFYLVSAGETKGFLGRNRWFPAGNLLGNHRCWDIQPPNVGAVPVPTRTPASAFIVRTTYRLMAVRAGTGTAPTASFCTFLLMFGNKIYHSITKSITLQRTFIQMVTSKNDRMIDFFGKSRFCVNLGGNSSPISSQRISS